MSVHRSIEIGFERWGRLVIRYRWAAIAVCLALTAQLASWLPGLRLDNSNESFLHDDDDVRVRYDRFKETFEREDRINVVLHPAEVFDFGFLETLRAIHDEIEREVPYVTEVRSLLNARNTRGEADALIVEELFERWPKTQAELDAIRERALANPLYVNALISADASHTIVAIEPFTWSSLGEADPLAGFDDAPGAGSGAAPKPLTSEEGFALLERLDAVLARHVSPELEAHVAGNPVFDRQMSRMLQRDVSVFMSISLAMVLALLYVLFRRVSGVVLPVVVVVGALLSSMGVMVRLDIPFSVTLNMLPAFLLVVGMCDSIHILTIVYKNLAAGQSREDAIVGALRHSGLAVAMTSITTAAGLASFTVAELAPIQHLGVLAPIGVMMAMLYSLVLLPALLAVVPLRAADATRGVSLRGALDRLLARAGELSTRRPLRTVAVAILLFAIGLPGAMRLGFSHNGLRWFPEDDPLRVAMDLIDREFNGANGVEVLVGTGEENGLYEPATLQNVERAMERAKQLSVAGHPVGNVTSIVDIVKETHRALHDDDPAFYRLPDERALLAQELLLFENSGSDDLREVTNSSFETARVSMRTPWVDAMEYPALLDAIDAVFRENVGPDVEIELTGNTVLFTRIFNSLLRTMGRSYVFALVVITPLMVLLIGNLRRGLVAMIPNLVPIYLVLALMGWTGIPLDASTLLIGGVVIGLAVDDTIHFMHKFSRYYEETGDARRAVQRTLATTGSALLFTTLVLTLGFGVMLFAYMENSFWFGLLAGTATIAAFAADILLAPALMVLVCEGVRTRPA